MPRPRITIKLIDAEIVVPFGPRTLAKIEREVGMSSFELGNAFKDPEKARYFDLGMRLVVGAIRAVHPEWTEETIDERLPEGAFMEIVGDIANAWAEAISQISGPVVEAASGANPTTPEATASQSAT